jgi:hypothetical protein
MVSVPLLPAKSRISRLGTRTRARAERDAKNLAEPTRLTVVCHGCSNAWQVGSYLILRFAQDDKEGALEMTMWGTAWPISSQALRMTTCQRGPAHFLTGFEYH